MAGLGAEVAEGTRQELQHRHLLADAPSLQAFTGDAPQLGEEVFLLPLGDTILRDAEIGLGSRAGGAGLGLTPPAAANTSTEWQITYLRAPRAGDSGICVALSTVPLDTHSPPAQPLTCSFSKTFFFGLSSASGSPFSYPST